MNAEPGTVAALLAWGTIVGVDLVSFPQALLSRPLVAGAGAGLLLGQPLVGLQVGLVLELFAMDVLPVGAARYPDFGPGVVGAVALASAGPVQLTLGLATLFALGAAVLGGHTLQWLRKANGRVIQRHSAGLAAGDRTTIAAVQYRGLTGDVLRSALLTGFVLGAAALLAPRLPSSERFTLVTAVAVGAALAAAAAGALRNAGRGARLRWLGAGLLVGLLVVAFR
jgi:PTS system mannose-specific IIC component